MRGRRAAGVAVLLALIAAIGVLFYSRHGNSQIAPASRPPAARPPLMLLTTLPLVFPDHFALNAPPEPALKALQSRYRIVPISVADAADLDHRQLLLMAQPQAQPAEALVDLDNWVRAGGHVLLLADPALEWPSERPLGSLLRPPFAFADTGLLAHWDLRLEAPDHLGPAERDVDGRTVHTESPGNLATTGRGCIVSGGGFIARCNIGKGRATIIADADFLNIASSLGDRANLAVLLIELERLEH
jgi:hypothetical protein